MRSKISEPSFNQDGEGGSAMQISETAKTFSALFVKQAWGFGSNTIGSE